MEELVGRRQELAALTEVLETLKPRQGAWAYVVGEPGIGKSRLISELQRRAERRGCLVLVGRGAELASDVPYGAVVDALDDYIGVDDRLDLASLGTGHLGHLARVFPSLAHFGPAAPTNADERYLTHQAVRALLERVAVRAPAMVALDDLHWADPATIELVNYLLCRPPAARVLLVLAWRPGEAPTLEPRIAEAARNSPGVGLRLGPLAEAEVAQLVGSTIGAEALETIIGDSGGNPFYAEQLGRAAMTAPSPPHTRWSAPSGERLPDAVAVALRAEVDRLPAGARLLAQGGAVAGEPFDLSLAAVCAGLDEAAAVDAIDILVAADVVRQSDGPRRFAFRHPIVRRGVYDSASPGWRISAHRRAEHALDEWSAPLAARAHHLVRCAGPGDADAVSTLAAAGREALSRAPASTAEWVRAALDLLPSGAAQVPQRVELLGLLANARMAEGHLEEAEERLVEALAFVPPEHPAWIRLVDGCAFVLLAAGRSREARDRLVWALGRLGPDDGRTAVLQLELAVSHIFALHFDQALEGIRQAAALVTSGDRPLLAVATALEALVLACLDDFVAAASRCDAAAALVDELSDDELVSRPEAPYFLGRAERLLERQEAAAHHLTRSRFLAQARGQAQLLVQVGGELASTLADSGRLAEAAEIAEAQVDSARLAPSPVPLAIVLSIYCKVLTLSGDLDGAIERGEEALAVLTKAGDQADPYRRFCRRTLAMAHLEAGAIDRCLELLDEIGVHDVAAMVPGRACAVYEALARAHLARGGIDVATGWVIRAEAAAAQCQLPLSTSRALHVRARLLLAEGRASQAASIAAEAAAIAGRGDARVEAARSLLLAGRCLAAAGSPDRAVLTLVEAEEKFAAAGAVRGRAEAARELRSLGRRTPSSRRRSTGAGLDALSDRERELAKLVAAGRTNREIAATLFLSDKTVETHLRHIFDKLGVDNRAAVAAAIGRSEANDGPLPAGDRNRPSRRQTR